MPEPLQTRVLALALILTFIPVIYASQPRSCPLDHFFDLQHCQKCAPNCQCSSENGCTACIDGYTMFRGNCIPCPQALGIYGTCSGCCSRTEGTMLACTNCQKVPGMYSFLFSGRCVLSDGCFQVNAYGYCVSCRSGYYSQDKLCLSCNNSCSTCSGPDNCLTCAAGYYWKVADYGLCSLCPTGCATCKNDSICTSCLTGYYFFIDHCLQCPSNCLVCVDGSTCTQCLTGILVSNLCIQCHDTTYGGSVGCQACYQQNNFVRCSSCDPTYFLDPTTGTCRSCQGSIPGAARCRDEKTPTQCKYDYNATLTSRYYLLGISCIANNKSCKKIADIWGNCSACYPNYIIQSGACILCGFTGCNLTTASVVSNICTCTACERGYYLTGVTCTACPTMNCAVCSGGVCSACLTGYYFSGGVCLAATVANCLQAKAGSAILCAICQDGYFKGSDQLCYTCQTNCLKCTDRFTCTTCTPASQLVGNVCISYPANCQEVVLLGSSLACTLCRHGYFLEGGSCLACSVELGTLSRCDGLCPIDYYIKSLMLQVNSGQEKLVTILVAVLALGMLL